MIFFVVNGKSMLRGRQAPELTSLPHCLRHSVMVALDDPFQWSFLLSQQVPINSFPVHARGRLLLQLGTGSCVAIEQIV